MVFHGGTDGVNPWVFVARRTAFFLVTLGIVPPGDLSLYTVSPFPSPVPLRSRVILPLGVRLTGDRL